MAAFVLGNGVSRQSIDVNVLLKLGPVYGCNALYRTHTPTVLVATDRPISEEIQQSGYAKNNRFHTRRPASETGALSVPKQYFGFSSGPIATSLAASDGNPCIYLLGFDLGPVQTGKFNNIYADTKFYKKSNDSATFTGNWVKQMCQITKDFKRTKFVRVYGATTAHVPEFDSIINLEKMELSDFVAIINNAKDL